MALLVAVSCRGPARFEEHDCTLETGAELYERRIRPVLEDDRPKSCNTCHLSGIDLTLYARDTPCQTFVCLYQEGLVDLAHPEESLVLDWIDRAEPDSELITAQVIAEEREGFLAWLKQMAICEACPNFGGQACGGDDGQGECAASEWEEGTFDLTDPGGCDDLALETTFLNFVYTKRGRCTTCHAQGTDAVDDAPKWLDEDACSVGALNTMRNIVQAGYLDLDEPSQSLFLLKPLSEEEGGVEHGGGAKMLTTETAYDDLLAWITRYAACAKQN